MGTIATRSRWAAGKGKAETSISLKARQQLFKSKLR
jgi:hypothetical protein